MILIIIYYDFEFGSKCQDLTFAVNEKLMCEGSTIYISITSQVSFEKNPFGRNYVQRVLFIPFNVFGPVCNHVLKKLMFIHMKILC